MWFLRGQRVEEEEGEEGGEEVGQSVKEEGALQVKMIKRHRHTKRERESYSVIGYQEAFLTYIPSICLHPQTLGATATSLSANECDDNTCLRFVFSDLTCSSA